MEARKISKLVLVVIVTSFVFFLAFNMPDSKNILIISKHTDEMERVKKILTAGEWHVNDEFGDVVLNFTNTGYTAVRTLNEDHQEEKIAGSYELTDVTTEDETWRTFTVKWLLTDGEKEIPNVTDLKIIELEEENKTFLLYSTSLPFKDNYFKHFDLVIASK